MSRSATGTFVDECLAGRAFLDDVDDWVERWHKSDSDGPGSLADCLGDY